MRLTSERLPWLPDEPPVTAPASPDVRAKPVGRAMWPWYLLLFLLVAMVAVGAWWLSTGQRDAAPPELPAETAIPVPVNRPAEPIAPAAPPAEAATAPVEALPAQPAPRAPATDRRQAELRVERRSSSDARVVRRPVFPADEPAISAPPQTGASPAIVFNPNPDRGRVVQLGAFPNRAQAEETWRRVTRRYPYLATKPKMVNSVDVRGLGGGRPTRMYRLQLGTSSQAQSVVICQQLERAGQSCVVVY
ncbi:SPOR domain-containing protein [Sphingomonas sp. LHG3406-1]|uniref:SPOR domain-containing protein n=1 Tax=Sphingomonas sp. LHG3406-1 TaxID=2804617 RepID=UPI0026259CCD|nr:SPOR domain-containing protein [Sphingomonas sp. LHG3406-1]